MFANPGIYVQLNCNFSLNVSCKIEFNSFPDGWASSKQTYVLTVPFYTTLICMHAISSQWEEQDSSRCSSISNEDVKPQGIFNEGLGEFVAGMDVRH